MYHLSASVKTASEMTVSDGALNSTTYFPDFVDTGKFLWMDSHRHGYGWMDGRTDGHLS